MTSLAVHADQPVEGVPLVLLHAFPLDSSMWSPVLPALRGIPVVTIDAPGFGDAPPREHAGLEEYAHDVVVAVRELGHDQAVIAGLSMGGYIAMAVAEATPGVLAGIGLLSTKAAADAEPAREKRLAMAAAADRGEPDLAVPMLDGLLGETSRDRRPDLVDDVRERLRTAPAAGIAWAQRSMAARPDRLAALSALPEGVPALVLRGAQDALMSDGDASAMAAALGAEVVEIADAGHLAALEAPDAVAAALSDLYRRAIG